MIVLDTNICIYLINNDEKYAPKILDRLTKHQRSDIFISLITVAELRFGAENSKRKELNLRLIDEFISNFNILPFGMRDAQVYGVVRRELTAVNRKIGDMDMLIAANILSRGCTLVTNNEKDSKNISGLKIENWT